jgi:hypothetical protein
MIKKTICIALLTVTQLALSQVSVGWDALCDYDLNVDANGLQQAIDDGATEIRLSNQNLHQTALDITENVILKGGYADCTAANAGTQTNINSVIDATGTGFPAVKVRSITDAQVTLDTLTIQNGNGVNNGSTSNWAGGLSIDQVTGSVQLNRINLKDNNGIYGGGLSVVNFNTEGSLMISVNNMAVQNNSASSNGGGIYCYAPESGFDLLIDMGSAATVRNNHSDNNGGGLYVDGCRVQFSAGVSTLVNSSIDKEIYTNSANASGAGIFAVGRAELNLIGTQADSFDVIFNQANVDTGVSGSGGGIFASSQDTVVNLTNSIISNNSTGRYGGGLFASFDAVINVDRSLNGCNYSDYCSQIIANTNLGLTSGGGGAMAVRFSAQLNIKNTLLRYNNSQTSGYITYSDPDGLVLLEGNLITENGNLAEYDNFTAFYQSGASSMTVAYNTLIQNNTNSTLFRQNGSTADLKLYGNIIKEFSNIHQSSNSITDINCNLINDLSSISVPMSNVTEGQVVFTDANNFDYRLAAGDVLAIDVCDAGIYMPGDDLDGKTRGTDNPTVVNDLGSYDLGAYEFDFNDLIFSSSFE